MNVAQVVHPLASPLQTVVGLGGGVRFLNWRERLILMADALGSARGDGGAPSASRGETSASNVATLNSDDQLPGPASGAGDAANSGTDEPPFLAVDDMATLVSEHSDAVYRVALSVTRDPALAEDVAQDSLIKAWQALPSYRGEAPLRNWLLRITHNTAVSALRKRREETRDPSELPELATGSTTETDVANRIAMDRFSTALDDLDETSRSIVVLREVEGLSYEEICSVLKLTLPTVKTRLLRSRRQLAKALDGWQP